MIVRNNKGLYIILFKPMFSQRSFSYSSDEIGSKWPPDACAMIASNIDEVLVGIKMSFLRVNVLRNCI